MGEPSITTPVKLILPVLCWSRQRSDFYAVTSDLSAAGLHFRSAVMPDLGEMLTCSIRHAGNLEALVVHRGRTQFVARVMRADRSIPATVRHLLDLADEQNVDTTPQRVNPRFSPDRPDILVTPDSGIRVPGRSINVSASGAAPAVGMPLEPGARIIPGRPPATVARPFEAGVGSAFLKPLAQEAFGSHVTL